MPPSRVRAREASHASTSRCSPTMRAPSRCIAPSASWSRASSATRIGSTVAASTSSTWSCSSMAPPPDPADVLGLESDRVRLRPYTSRWAELFALEAPRIRAALGAMVVDVQHVGSTSIPGLMAKPILDIVVGLDQLAIYPLCIGPLATLGYEHVPWQGLAQNEVFSRGTPRTHLVHVVEHGGEKWRDYLKFRE